MNLPEVPLFNILRERMGWLSQRQGLLSQNVANADTPGYSALDLKPVDFTQALKDATAPNVFHGGLTVTDPKHITMAPENVSDFETVESGESESNPAGNSVSVEEEMMKVADTQAQYQAASDLYAKAVQMTRTAIDKSGP